MDPNKETEEINHFPSFFDDFIEDNVLLELIHTETSIHKIGCYLKWKCERIKRNRSCKSDFCIRNILNNEDCSLLTKKTALHYALMCQETNREFINCLKWFDEKLGTVDLNNYRKTLEIYSIAEVIIEVKYETAEEILVHIHVDRLKIWLFNVTQLKFNTECLSNVPSHFLKYLNEVVSSEQDFINDIVAHLISQNNLDFLCVLFESELTQLSTAACFQKEELWKLIQNHIDDVNTTKRKQSRYMLFKTIEFYKTNDLLTVPDILRAESFQHWDSYFILLDISKEKQLHLILPTLKLLKAIINLQLTWQICLYKLLLKHSQLSVVYKTLEHIFTLKFKLTSDHRELLRNVLNALNKYEYSNLCLRVFDKFGIFCCEFDELCRDMLFDEFLEINWNPAACWCFLKSVSPILYKIQHCTFQKIFSVLRTLPHTYIRNSCILLFLLKVFVNRQGFVLEEIRIVGQFLLLTDFEIDKEIFNRVLLSNKTIIEKESDEMKRMILVYITEKNERDLYIHFQIMKMLKITINLDAGHTYSNICDILILFSDVIGRTDILRYLLDRFDLSELPVTQFPWMNYPYVPDLLDKALAEPSLVPIETDLIKSNFPRSNFKDLRILVLQMIKSGNYMEYKGEDYYKLWLRGIRYCLDSFYDDTEIAKLIEKFKLLLDVGYPKFTRLVAENLDLLPKYASTRKLSESIHIYDYCLRRICLLPNTYSKPFSVIFFRAVLHFNLLSSEIFIDYWKSWYSSLFEEHFLECDIVMKVILEGCRKLIQLEAPNMCIFAPLILTGLKNGIVVKKNQRVEYGICQDISHVIENFSSNNPNFIAMELKMLAMESLYLLSKMENSLMKPDRLVGILVEMYKENFKIRYFPGSKIHLEKLRICQAFLMLVHSVTSSKHQFIQFILDTFSEESHQPSVKHLLQWLLIILLSSNPVEHFCILVEKINTASLSHPSFVIALIPVLYHLVLLMNDSKFWFEVTDTLLPWTMGANFKLRVYCQVALKELLKKAQERQLTEYINKYSFLESTFMKVLECTGTSVEDTMKFDLFFIEKFDPKLHFSMENIFIKIPKSLDVPSYEWENIKDYEFSKKFDMKIWNEPDFPIYTKTETIEVEDNIEASGMNVQKKIIPWKSALDETVNNRILGNLICVASLVDKSSNLGGLSRTCEVFSIRQLVLHNCKIIDDKEFKSLSMSSENWVEFIEVKRDDLSNFLTKMKQDGYSLIGLEQTSESQKLHEFKFPEKIVLLLGNEKEGISAPLLPLLDSCVEIPQFGQTRSLNVHVAGATFIWEYVRQRLSPTQKT